MARCTNVARLTISPPYCLGTRRGVPDDVLIIVKMKNEK
jgi:hypothetical protein